MDDANLFQLGIGLETGAHAEDLRSREAAPVTVEGPRGGASNADLLDDAREDHFIRRDGRVFAGTHLIIEVVNGHGLDEEARIQQAFRDCVEECGATLLHIHTHKFSPQGVSGVAVLAESHISVHTWPEIGYGAFDVFMCGDATPWRAVDVLRAAFGTEDVRVRELLRGDGLVVEDRAA
ncbi:adenosylmethionine decarboxylase [Rhodobacteraceae bacterium WD3A24]|nr:adenosylmethionine decarboxylase [Rhodobacteraceae bacterium WD3A24]